MARRPSKSIMSAVRTAVDAATSAAMATPNDRNRHGVRDNPAAQPMVESATSLRAAVTARREHGRRSV